MFNSRNWPPPVGGVRGQDAGGGEEADAECGMRRDREERAVEKEWRTD